jgi:predicted O-linked N-acetylglucosamine transferase (SPINDLY family)
MQEISPHSIQFQQECLTSFLVANKKNKHAMLCGSATTQPQCTSRFGMVLLGLLILIGNVWLVNSNELSLQNYLDLALRSYNENDFDTSIRYLQNALLISPNHVDVNGVLGSVYLAKSDVVKGIKHLEISLQYGGFSNSENIANYLHGLLLNREYSKGLAVFQQTVSKHSSNLRFFVNGILLYHHLERTQELYQCANQYLGRNLDNWLDIIRRMNEKGYLQLAENLGRNALKIFGENVELIFQIAVSLHFQNNFAEALQLYQSLVDRQPNNTLAINNIGAIHQVLGNNDEAKKYYGMCAERLRHEAGFLNNFGLLLLQGSKEDEIADGVKMLEQALEIDPYLENALVNLASYYLDQLSFARAEDLYRQALTVSESPKQVEICLATLMSPVVSSWSQMLNERKNMILRLQSLVDQGQASEKQYQELDATIDRIHFYIVYSGLNDRYIQESISQTYHLCIRNLSKMSSYLPPKPIALPMSGYRSSPEYGKSSRIKVGFMSKYFGVYEPHGMLLDGIMKYLPRSLFEVFVLTFRPNEGKYLSPIVAKSSDHVIFIPLVHALAFQQISDLRLDVVIFADTLCEPTTHFLAQTRMAPLQVAFWGNPVTSGSKFIDYFISSDFMEHPYRSRLPQQDEPYTEQVVLLPGQGIWYSSPDSSDSQEIIRFLNLSVAPQDETFQRTDFGLEDDWFIFFCPQSLFKLHPLFDKVLASILQESPKSHLVLTTGRKKIWTSVFLERLTKSLGPLTDRFHMIERITAQKFFALIKLADVLLHPFPFDGSRTSADSLSVGIPFVTLPSEYLRGRMGASLLRTLNLPELVAHNVSEYIQIAVRLSTDQSFYSSIKSLIVNRSWLIWNDMLAPYSWTSFLATSTGLPVPSWEKYLASFDLDVVKESNFRIIREQNQETFDLRWGKETWLLDQSGIPHLPQLIGDHELLPIFENWRVADPRVQNLWNPTRDHLLNLAHEHAIAGSVL